KWIDRFEFVGSGVELLAAHVGGRVDDLALKVGVIDDVKVHEAEGTHARSGEIERQGRAESTGADAKNLRSLELELALHADFGHDQVARVAEDLVVSERHGFGFDVWNGGHKNLGKLTCKICG